MPVQPGPWPEVPAETARVAGAAFPRGSLAVRVRDELGAWCAGEAFGPVYGVRGAPGISPARLAVITALQFAENLTGRQAADAVRGRIGWKYRLGLVLTGAGFDPGVLSGFRSRLAAGSAERLLLDLLPARLEEAGLVRSGGRQRTGSTHVLARIRGLNRLAGVTGASWQQAYGQRICGLRLPEGKAARAELAVRCARDGYRLLEQAQPAAAPPWLRDLPAVRALRLILLQQFYRETGQDGEKVTWREDGTHGLPPGRARIVSPCGPGARRGEKRGEGRAGVQGAFHRDGQRPGRR